MTYVSASQAAKGVIKNSNSGGSFKVALDGRELTNVDGVSTGGAETEVIEYQDGEDMTIRKRPGRTKYANIVLKRGLAHNADLWEWYQKVIKGVPERKSISVVILKRDGAVAKTYNYFEAWPCRWEGPTLGSIGDPDFDLLRVGGDPDFDLLRATEQISFCVERMGQK